jgi:hypothetical protein
LKIDEILAIFHLFGKTPASKELLTIHDRLCEIQFEDILRIFAGMLSFPVALLGFKLANMLEISTSVVGRKWNLVGEELSNDEGNWDGGS